MRRVFTTRPESRKYVKGVQLAAEGPNPFAAPNQWPALEQRVVQGQDELHRIQSDAMTTESVPHRTMTAGCVHRLLNRVDVLEHRRWLAPSLIVGIGHADSGALLQLCEGLADV